MAGRHAAAPRRRARRHGAGPARRGGAVAAVVLALCAVGWWLSPLGGTSCEQDRMLTVAAAPEIAPVLQEVTADLGSEDLGTDAVCGVSVVASDPDDVLSALDAGAYAPDLWVPDTSVWLSQLPPELARRTARSLATSPVVLAGPAGDPRPQTWLAALSAPDAALLDPRESGASVAALMALHAEAARGRTSGTALSSWLVGEAKSTRDHPVSDADLLAAETDTDLPRRFPTTEQRFVAEAGREDDPDLALTVPETGTTLLDYPMVSVATGADAETAAAAAQELAEHLRSARSERLLAEAGFRSRSGAPLDLPEGAGRVREIGAAADGAVADLLTTWSGLNADARMLAVLDVSGSMRDREGSRTRVQLARDAMLTALGSMPDTWDVGLWAFSVGLGEGRADHRVLAPVQTLAADAGRTTHRAALTRAVRRLPRLVGGGTALYDTTLAAYRAVASGYLSDRFNSVVLLTDGRNEDPAGLSLRRLVDALRRESANARPVPVVTVGMGPQADNAALRRIAAATGGASYVTRDPRDIEQILADAFLEQVGWRVR